MKSVILSLFIASLFLIGCDAFRQNGSLSKENPVDYKILADNHKIVVIDSCQYIVYTTSMGYGYSFMAHKGNCSNPIHKQKTMKELIFDKQVREANLKRENMEIMLNIEKHKIELQRLQKLVESDK